MQGRRGVAVALALLALTAASVPSSLADPEAVERAEDQLEAAERDARAAQARLEQLGARVSVAVEEYNHAAVALDEVRVRLADQLRAIERVQRRIARRSAVTNDFARHLYQRGTAFDLASMLTSDSVTDFQDRAYYLRTVADSHITAVELLKVDRNLELEQLSQLERTEAEATAAERNAATAQQEVEDLLAEQEDEAARLHEVVAAAERQLATVEAVERERLEAERRAREEAARQRALAEAAALSGPPPPSGVVAPNPRAQTAVDAAVSQVGKPYVYAADGPDSYDCSGLTMWAWQRAGVSLPHSSRAQYAVTARIGRSELAPGDFLFFGNPIHHVAMYIGNGKVVEAPYTGAKVRINEKSIYRSDIHGYGRVR